jgi:hypothetical protein
MPYTKCNFPNSADEPDTFDYVEYHLQLAGAFKGITLLKKWEIDAHLNLGSIS